MHFVNKVRSFKLNETRWRILTTIYVAFLICINFVRIFDNDFWGDEAFSIRLANMSLGEMLTETAKDVHPPLYYINLIFANRLIGNYGWLYHFVSFIPFLILIIFGTIIIKRQFGREASLLFVTLVGISTEAVKYNVEVRMYSLSALYVLLAYYAFWKILNKESRGCVLFVCFSLGAAYSHYYAMMSVAILYLALFIQTILKRFAVKRLIIVYISTIVGYIPWLLQMIIAFKRTSEDFWMTEVPGFFESLSYFFNSNYLWYSWGMLVITLLSVGALIYKDIESFCKEDDETQKALDNTTIWLIWGMVAAFGTLIIGEIISVIFRPAFMVRYLYPVVPVLWLVLCVALSRVKNGKAATYVLIFVSLCVFSLMYIGTYTWDYNLDKKCRNTQEEMIRIISKGDVILTDIDHLEWTILDYYLPEANHKKISNEYDGFDENVINWLVWSKDLSEADTEWIKGQGYCAKEVICDGILGTHEVHVYKLETQ